MSIQQIGIVGGGQMGGGIAEVASRKGLRVVVREADDALVAAARARLEKSLARGVERGKLEAADRNAALGRVSFTTDLDDLAAADLVIEAIPEHLATKEEVFRALDQVTQPATVLATNTSSIPIMRIALATGRPESVIGLHFFNPVPVMELVEVIPSLTTSEETVDRAVAFAESLGKRVVRAPDRAGFVVNALLVPFLLDAVRMFEAGHATAEDIDTGLRYGANHPMGPLALCDLIGNDTMLGVADAMYAETHLPHHAAPQLLRRMVEAGHLGRKSGRGFYEYS